MIIVPLESSFGNKMKQDQQATIVDLQVRANNAGLRGKVVPVWDAGGRMDFIAPQQWHSYLSGLNLRLVLAKINKEIFW